MNARRPFLSVLGTSVLALGALAACDAPTDVTVEASGSSAAAPLASGASKAKAPEGKAFFKVYDRNVFLGGDTGPLFVLDFSPGNIVEIVAAVDRFWQEVVATGTGERAAAVADDIAETNPHVVALQEVAAYAVVDLATLTPVDGRSYLVALQAELAARGLDYVLVAQQAGTDAQLPLALGPTGPTHVLAFQVGEAVLVRGDLTVAEVESGFYQDFAQLGPVALKRGFIRVEIPFEGVPHHVVTTQLETQGLRSIHDPQGEELLARFGDLDGITVLTGDLNSDAAGQPGDPSWTPTYGLLTAHGFVDGWLDRVGPRDLGLTCCWDPDLTGGSLNQRLDLVLLRASDGVLPRPGGSFPGAIHVDLVGEESADRTEPSGLWPSDHVGLVSALGFPGGLTAHRR